MAILVQGGNCAIPNGELTIAITYSKISDADIDVSAFQLALGGKVRGDADMCFYGQQSLSGGALRQVENSPGRVLFKINPARIESAIEKVVLTATIHENRTTFSQCSALNLTVVGAEGGESIEAPIATAGMKETALILGELYLRNGQWKFRLVAQGFSGGLAPLARTFGVDIAAPVLAPPKTAPAPPLQPQPVPAPATVNLAKITLDKRTSSVSLEKKADFGEIKVNLNWHRLKTTGGFLGFGRTKELDLDLGCLFELKNGQIGVVQALGDCFGDYRREPFIELMGDDRTGAVSDGEWLRINGSMWNEVKRIMIFAFIYEGAPNWTATDAVVTMYVPGQPPIEVRLNEEGGRDGLCGIALLENIGGAVKVSREVKFFSGHEYLDKAYRWGLRWRQGSK